MLSTSAMFDVAKRQRCAEKMMLLLPPALLLLQNSGKHTSTSLQLLSPTDAVHRRVVVAATAGEERGARETGAGAEAWRKGMPGGGDVGECSRGARRRRRSEL